MSYKSCYRQYIYYDQIDKEGILYHANYLSLFDHGRTDWLRELGFPINELAEQGIAFAVSSVQVDFKKPARLGDEIEIVTEVKQHRCVSLLFEQKLYLAEQQEQCLCAAEIHLVCVNGQLKPQKIPQAIITEIHNASQSLTV